MKKYFTALNKADSDFYNDHPVAHLAIVVAYTILAVALVNKLSKNK